MPSPEPRPTVCEQCGLPLAPGTADVGCLHCLLGGVDPAAPACAGLLTDSPQPAADAAWRYDHYEVLRRPDGTPLELGRGAMGVTYKAEDINLRVPVALKVIDADYATHPQARDLFLREARSAARLRHPNVATVYHFGTFAPGPAPPGALVEDADPTGVACFYAMEFVDGETLDSRVRRVGPLPPFLALEVALQIARALVAAEARGLVHRDLKPANVMLADGEEEAVTGRERRREPSWVKVIDFGLAKAVRDAAVAEGGSGAAGPLTHGALVGTPGFASPEQYELAEVDVRADVYSLGATLWFALTGGLPYAGDTLAEVHDRQTHRPLPLAQLSELGTPAPLVALLETMLAPDPARRPASAQALCAALEDCLARVQARPRRWGPAMLTAAVALAVVLLAAFHPWRRSPADPAQAVPPAVVDKSIAVLPFDNFSEDKNSGFFAEGVQDEVLTNLSKVADLKVISRSSVMQYKQGNLRNLREIGQALGVAYVVEGSVQKAAGNIRVMAKLVDARTDAQRWAEQYDRPLDDVFAIQSDIAQAIADQLRARISPAEHAAMTQAPTTDVLAFQLYQQAVDLDNHASDPDGGASLFQAATLLDEALARDPRFLRAWYLLATVHLDLYWNDFDHTEGRRQMARAAVDSAVRLQPDAGLTHVARAIFFYRGERDYAHALEQLAQAWQTLPNDSDVIATIGAIHRRQGRWDDALREFERANELDPRNLETLQETGLTYAAVRRYPEAAHAYNRALAAVPGDVFTRASLALLSFYERADLAPLRALNASILAREPSAVASGASVRLRAALADRDAPAARAALAALPSAGWQYATSFIMPKTWFVGLVARTFGDAAAAGEAFTAARAEVDAVVQAQSGYAQAWSALSLIDAGLGRREEAAKEGRRACELLPLTLDAYEGSGIASSLAVTYAWTGRKNEALEQLELLVRLPGGQCDDGIHYGGLKADPQWDPLRGEPRFQALVASLAPKR